MIEPSTWSELTHEQRNALIAEHVMHQRLCVQPSQENETDYHFAVRVDNPDGVTRLEAIPDYTTSMDAVWPIVERMVARMDLEYNGFAWDGPRYKAAKHYFSSSQHIPGRVLTGHFDYTSKGGFKLDEPCWYVTFSLNGLNRWIMADTPQEAICLAALAVEAVEQGDDSE